MRIPPEGPVGGSPFAPPAGPSPSAVAPIFAVEADRWLAQLTHHLATARLAGVTVASLPAAVRELLDAKRAQAFLDVSYWVLAIVAWRERLPQVEIPRAARRRAIQALLEVPGAQPLGQVLEAWSIACRELVRLQTN
ncbi:MAG TPA: hypothetical protein VNJ70_17970 [Thermoanaerobaculia bacterium]|nr:hypothetical protein [Thermoanaerobaculia bacterium]